MQQSRVYFPVRLEFGPGRLNDLATLWSPSWQKILLVSDSGVAQHTTVLDQIRQQLTDYRLIEFLEIEENPSFATIERGAQLARQERCDCVLAVGGGSPMDAGKGIALVAPGDVQLSAFLAGHPVNHELLPVVCIPTTAGTGSEATPYAVFTDTANQNKCGYGHDRLYPALSIVDPLCTHSMPVGLTCHTGLDVLAHAAESLLCMQRSPFSDSVAAKALEMVVAYLPKACQGEPEARAAMSYAAMLAGVAIAHAGTILPHIMGYPLTVFHGVPHGLASAILLPRVLDYLRRYGNASERVDIVERFFASAGGINAFFATLGVSTKLADYGVTADELPLFAQKVIVKGDIAVTPAPITENDLIALYHD